MSTLHSDICIVGAGPAGAVAALTLANAKIPHLLLDAARFPRDKVCGDGLDLKVIRVLRQLNPDWVNELNPDNGFAQAWGARMITPAGESLDYALPLHPDAAPLYRVARRMDFDDFLVRRLNAEWTDFRQQTAVSAIQKTPEGWMLQAVSDGQPLQITCRLLIGADGDHSVVLRGLGERKIERRHYAASQRQYWKQVEGLSAQGFIEFYFPKRYPWSYFWIFPLPDGSANVGFIMLSEAISRYKVNVREALQDIIENDPVMAPRFVNAQAEGKAQGWGLPLSSRRRRIYGDGYLLAGDAASLICPVTGEGIGTAMLSGYLAGQFAEKAVSNGRFEASDLSGYERQVYRRLADENRLADLLWYAQKLPWSWSAWLLNTVLPAKWMQWAFRRMAKGWMQTAFHRPIRID